MEVTFLGKNSFKFKTKTLTFLVDPTNTKERADVVVYTGVEGTVEKIAGPVSRDQIFVINREGEYELGGVGIIVDRLEVGKNSFLVRFNVDGVGIADVAGVSTEVDEKTKEKLQESDVLLVPIVKAEIIEEAEPYIAVLCGYEDLSEVDRFLADHKFEVVRRDLDKLKLEAGTLPENTEVVVLNGKP